MSIFTQNPFYHETVKRLIAAFGALFNNMHIIKYNDAGEVVQRIQVPVKYAPRNKWISMLNEDPTKQAGLEFTLPRIVFEIKSYKYNNTRKIGNPNTASQIINSDGSVGKLFSPTPYDIEIVLSTLCKDQNDSLALLEQILPYFNPSMSIEVTALPTLDIKKQIQITLNDVSVNDSYEGLTSDFRLIEQTFNFTAQIDLFGPVNNTAKVIKHTEVSLGANANDVEINTQIVEPQTANKTDTYVITETWGFE